MHKTIDTITYASLVDNACICDDSLFVAVDKRNIPPDIDGRHQTDYLAINSSSTVVVPTTAVSAAVSEAAVVAVTVVRTVGIVIVVTVSTVVRFMAKFRNHCLSIHLMEIQMTLLTTIVVMP